MENASTIATALTGRSVELGGSLCFWGMSFGRPMDNWHQLVSASAHGDLLSLKFKEGEELSVTLPRGFELSGHGFKIRSAKKVVWSWIYYGRPKTTNNELVWHLEEVGADIEFKTSLPMQVAEPPKRDHYAVEMT